MLGSKCMQHHTIGAIFRSPKHPVDGTEAKTVCRTVEPNNCPSWSFFPCLKPSASSCTVAKFNVAIQIYKRKRIQKYNSPCASLWHLSVAKRLSRPHTTPKHGPYGDFMV